MEAYVLKSVKQVLDWIDTQRLEKWVISHDKVDAGDRATRVVVSTTDDMSDQQKLDYTEKMLKMMQGMKLYARGWRKSSQTTGLLYAEICIEPEGQQVSTDWMKQMQQMIGATQMQPAVDEDKLAERVRKEVAAEYERKELERVRKELDAERKEFNEQRDGVVGLLVHYFAPVAQQFAQNMTGGRTAITGTQMAGEAVEADAIHVATEPDEQEEQSVFTEAEQEELEQLMERLQAVEPRYLELLRKVVELAEAGDSTYTMAKSFLLK